MESVTINVFAEESRRMPGNTRSSKWRSTGINEGRGKSLSFII